VAVQGLKFVHTTRRQYNNHLKRSTYQQVRGDYLFGRCQFRETMQQQSKSNILTPVFFKPEDETSWLWALT
jgi:hypothetical protein